MENKRHLIIQAAISIFARKGLEKGKIADIAIKAGIGKGTIYEYFRSKEEIFSAIEETMMTEMLTAIENVMNSDITAREKLQTIMDQSMDMMQQMGDALLIITELWSQAARNHWHGRKPSYLEQIYDTFRNNIRTILQSGIAAGEFRPMNKDGVATLLIAFMDGLAWQFMLLKDEKRFKTIKSEAIRSFMKGIEK